MAKFMLVRFSVMAEITDAGALREAALENFDADDSTYGYPAPLTGTHRRKASRSAARSPPRTGTP